MPAKKPIKKVNYFVSHWRLLLASAAAFLVLVVASVGPLVWAGLSSVRIQEIQTKNAAISQAILNKDYSAWQSLVTDERLLSRINEQNFATYAEAFVLLEAGKIEEAELLQVQLGLQQKVQVVSTKSAQISQAIATKDYDTWRALVGANYAGNLVTPDNFSAYADLLSFSEQGKINKANRLEYSLGLKQRVQYSSAHE